MAADKTHDLRLQSVHTEQCELTVRAGPDNGRVQQFGQPRVRLGSHANNDFVLRDAAVSRFHAQLEHDGRRFRLTDLDSTNGTRLAGHRIKEAWLEGPAMLQLGDTHIMFQPLGTQAEMAVFEQDHMGPLIGSSLKMRCLYAELERIAGSDLPVIVCGETGTGKELAAQTIHQHSPRRTGAFEVLDCGAVASGELIQSELFGHVRGAFTGAHRDRMGVFERARGGTVFLDEIGELALDLQPKLLRVLETKTLRRVGGEATVQVDVRIVAATHRSLQAMVNEGRFREDLYYRLCGWLLELPPLRSRPEDIPALVSHFLRALAERQPGVPQTLAPDQLEALQRHNWPGNVRQLRHSVERLVLSGGRELPAAQDRPSANEATPEALITMPLKQASEQFEQRYLRALVRELGSDLQVAAERAGMHPKSLARLLREYGIERT